MKNKVFIIILSSWILSCNPPRIPLTKAERALQSSLSAECKCNAEIMNDYRAITNNLKDGTFAVGFTFNDIVADRFRDSIWRKKYALNVYQRTLTIMSHKTNYKYFIVGFTTVNKLNENLEEAKRIGEYQFSMPK
jgi:hypothetical protein